MKKLISIIICFSLALSLFACIKAEGPTEATTVLDGQVIEYMKDNPEKISQIITYEKGTEVSRDKYEYNESGDISRIITVIDGEAVQIIDYAYSDKSISEVKKTYTDGGIAVSEVSALDENGNIKSTSYYEDNEFVGEERYSYNDDGDMIRADEYNSLGESYSYKEYEYDSKGQITKASLYEFGSLSRYWEYLYVAGEIIYITEYDSAGNLISEEIPE